MAKKKFTAEFKAKVAIEALKGNKTINELTSECGRAQYSKTVLIIF